MPGSVRLETFQAVINKQRQFRHMLNELIEEERWLKSEVEGRNKDGEESSYGTERDKYYTLLAWSLVGVGTKEEYSSTWKDFKNPIYFKSYGRFLSKAGQISEDYDIMDDNGNKVYASPSKVWKNVKDAFLDQSDMALREAFRQSPEREQRIGPKTKEV